MEPDKSSVLLMTEVNWSWQEYINVSVTLLTEVSWYFHRKTKDKAKGPYKCKPKGCSLRFGPLRGAFNTHLTE